MAEIEKLKADIESERAKAGAGTGGGTGFALSGWGWSSSASEDAPTRYGWGLLPPGMAEMSARSAQGDDITGRGANQTKRARAVGVGRDADTQRVEALEAWSGGADVVDVLGSDEIADILANRAAILAEVMRDKEEGRRLLTLAGGAGWGDGKRVVHLTGGGMAARAARYLHRRRGALPSDTSLEEAAAAATAAAWVEWCCQLAVSPYSRDDAGGVIVHWRVLDDVILPVCGAAWRAAFRSLTRDSAGGMVGRHAGQGGGMDGGAAVPVPLEGATLQVERASLAAWAADRQGRIFSPGKDDAQRARRDRRRVLAWCGSVLQVNARHITTRRVERSRFSLLARLVHGRDIATAARGAGFASGRAAVESFRAGRVWPRLRAAIAARVGAQDRQLMALRLRAVRRAMDARARQQTARAGAGAHSVNYVRSLPGRRWKTAAVGTVGSGRIVLHYRAGRLSPVHHPLAATWARATEERGAAVAVARAARAALIASRAARVADFDAGTKGLRAGWLR